MNYQRIIFAGFTDLFDQKTLVHYYTRAFKNAEKENYSIEEFFYGCEKAANSYTKMIESRIPDIKKGLENRLEEWENTRDYHNQELKDFRITSLKEHINNFDEGFEKVKFKDYIEDNSKNQVEKKLCKDDFNKVIKALEEVRQQLEPKKKTRKPTDIAPLNFNLNQTDIIHFFDLLVDSDIIKEPNSVVHRGTKGGFYGKLSNYFTAKGKPINADSAKSIKTNKSIRYTSYSDSYYQMLEDLKKTIEQKLVKKGLL